MSTNNSSPSAQPVSAAPGVHLDGHSFDIPTRTREFLLNHPEEDVCGSGPTHTACSPFDGQALFAFPVAQAADIDSALSRARTGQAQWQAMGIAGRSRAFLRLHDAIAAQSEVIMDLIQLENGKSRAHAFDEVMDLLNCARFYATRARKAFGPERHAGALPVLTTTRTQHYPLGIVGLISPWNYPLSLGVGDVLAALIAGNAVVHKPDSQTVLTAIFVRRLALAAGLPADAWQLVPGNGAEVGDALIPQVDGVSFTGSTKVGKSIAAQAAEKLVPCMLELGGKNPLLVLADAPLAATVAGTIRAAFSSSGQLCMSAERAYVHADIFDAFVSTLRTQLSQVSLGAAFDDTATIGSLTSQRQLEAVQAHVEDAVSKGAQVIAGGKHRPDLGPFFFEPTVLAGVTPEMDCYANETFGPVLSVYKVSSDAEAIRLANDSDYGLAASVWTGNSRHGWEVATQIEAGMVNINEGFAAAYGSISAPGGGVKESGLNHRHGITGMRLWCNERTVAQQRLHPIAPSDVISPKTFRSLITTGMKLMKAVRM